MLRLPPSKPVVEVAHRFHRRHTSLLLSARYPRTSILSRPCPFWTPAGFLCDHLARGRRRYRSVERPPLPNARRHLPGCELCCRSAFVGHQCPSKLVALHAAVEAFAITRKTASTKHPSGSSLVRAADRLRGQRCQSPPRLRAAVAAKRPDKPSSLLPHTGLRPPPPPPSHPQHLRRWPTGYPVIATGYDPSPLK